MLGQRNMACCNKALATMLLVKEVMEHEFSSKYMTLSGIIAIHLPCKQLFNYVQGNCHILLNRICATLVGADCCHNDIYYVPYKGNLIILDIKKYNNWAQRLLHLSY